jgi:hypothetical protein
MCLSCFLTVWAGDLQQAGDSNRDLAAQRYRQIESLSDSLFRVKGDLQEKNRHMDERDRRVAELQNEVGTPAHDYNNNNDNNSYTFPVRGLGVHLDHLVNSVCPCFSIFAQRPPIDVYPFHPMQF